jgi:outer membrane protein TolC
MSLQQAIDLALQNNLDLKVAKMNAPAVDYQLQAARAAFNPQFTGTYSYNDQDQVSNSRTDTVLTGGSSVTYSLKNQQYNMGYSESTPWYGGRINGTFNNSRRLTTQPSVTFTPTYNANFSATYTQPLLATRAIDNNRNNLRTLAVQRQITDIQLLTSIENTKASVRTAYWNLRQAIETIEIQRRALDLAQRLLNDNNVKVQIGTMAPIETTQSETQVANAEQALLAARVAWQTAQINFQRLLATGPDDQIFQQVINPSEQPALSVQSVDIPGAVKTALDQRTDLVQARKNIEVSQMNLDVTKDLLKPELDLQGGYSAIGQNAQDSATQLVTGYGAAASQLFGLELPTWNLQFNLTYPLFMRAAKANYARAALLVEQSQAQLKSTEMTVSTSVTNAGLAIENGYQQYLAAKKASEVAQKNADAEQTRFDVGMSTNYNVVTAQNNLTQQRLNELRALITYLNAIAEFDRQQRVGGTAQ